MSQHKSFKRGGAGGKKRNVLKRFERVELLVKRRELDLGEAGARVMGLKKTKPDA